MRKVRITKEQLEAIVESTLNTENAEVVSEDTSTEEVTEEVVAEETVNEEILEEGIDMAQMMELVGMIGSADWPAVMSAIKSNYGGIQEFMGLLASAGLGGAALNYVKSSMNKYFKENPEHAPKA